MDHKKSINGLFLACSLYGKKNKNSFFHKPSKKDDISVILAKLIMNNHEIARAKPIKFLGVLQDENLNWKTNKIH